MPNAYIYVRFSTKAQDRGSSAARQKELCTAFAKERGWTVVETLSDTGRSAWKGHHLSVGHLGEFEKRVRAGEIEPGSVLVAELIDRLSRLERKVTQRWIEDMCGMGVSIAIAQDKKVFTRDSLKGVDGLIDVIQILLKAQLAEDESNQKSMRMRKAWEEAQAATKTGKVLTLQAPAWLRVRSDRSGFDVIPERGDLVRQIFQWAAEGYGDRAIVRKLNERQAPPWGHGKTGWTTVYVNRLIRAHQVEGDYIPRSVRGIPAERIPYYPRVVDADLVARARAAKESRKRTGGNNGVTYSNLFMGLFRCANCGGTVEMRKPSKAGNNGPVTMRGYLSCNAAALRNGCDRSGFIKYGPFEDAAVDAILHLALDDAQFQKSDETFGLKVNLAEEEKAAVDLREQAQRLVRLLAKRDSPAIEAELEVVEVEIRNADKRVKDLQGQLLLAKGSVSPKEHLQRVLEVRDALKSADPETRYEARRRVHEAIKGVVQMVICDTKDPYRDGAPKKTLTLVLTGGVHSFKFDNEGKLLGSAGVAKAIDAGNRQMLAGVTSVNERAPEAVAKLLKRRAKRFE